MATYGPGGVLLEDGLEDEWERAAYEPTTGRITKEVGLEEIEHIRKTVIGRWSQQ